ncbi:MAG: flagellar motor switch protein FliM [Vicinamibacterales bacterium]
MATIVPRPDLDALGPPSAPVAYVRYNFRRPDRVSKEQIRALQFLHERFARHVSTSLAAYLRSSTELSLVSVEQFTYAEFLLALPDPTAYYAVSLAPLDAVAGLEINPAVAFAMIDRMLGGDGQPVAVDRALTDIEQNVIDSVVTVLLDSLAEAWRPLVGLRVDIRARETRPQMLQVASPNDTVVMLVFDMRVGDARGAVHLCLPAELVERGDAAAAGGWNRRRLEPTELERAWLVENLGRVPMPVSAVLDTHCRAGDVATLAVGDVLSLDVPAETPIDLRVGETLKFRARMAELAGRVRARIEHRCDGAGEAEA